MSRTLSHAALAVLALTTLACAAAEPDVPLQRLLSVARPMRATHVVERRAPDSLRALGKGWSVDINAEQVEGFWAVGKESVLNLVTAQNGAHRLVFEVSPPVGATAQGLTFRLNGERLATALTLVPGWKEYEVELPDSLLHIGYNQLVLSFAAPLQPSLVDPESGDDRQLAARFLYLRVAAPLEAVPPGAAALPASNSSPSASATDVATGPGPLWRPRVVELPESEATAIELPTDSILDLALRLPAAARLVGNYTVEFDSEPVGAIQWAAELITDDGQVHALGDGDASGGWIFSDGLSANLAAWGGRDVLLRLRTWGSTRGTVRWSGLGLSTRGEALDLRQFDPPPLPIPEISGRLGKTDVVMILLDAARADAFSVYGGNVSTPAVDALAKEGTRFERAYAAAPWTGQSVYSIFTGRYPEGHGVGAWKERLPAEITSLFQNVHAAGYRTYLWTEHPVYRATKSLRFDVTKTIDLKPRQRPERFALLPKAKDLFVDDQPTFAFVHIVPPHDPYEAPAPYGGTLSNWYEGDFSPKATHLQKYSAGVGLAPPSSDELRYVHSLYLENVQYADDVVGRVVRTLKRAGRYDDATIVLLSDHGEAFYEHGHFLHTWPMYEEAVHVPLVIKWPAAMTDYAATIDTPVSLIDLAPTVLDGIGVDAEGLGYQGYSLLPPVFDGSTPARDIYASTVGVSLAPGEEAPPLPMAILIRGQHKVIFDRVSGEVELYDLEADPGENDNLIRAQPVTGQLLLQRLVQQLIANRLVLGGLEGTDNDVEIDPEIIERLRNLGYTGSKQ